MNKAIIFLGLLASVAFTSFAKKNEDPVLMTVNGKNVPLSEFTYLYNKNNGQQQTKMSLDDYLELFTVYKLKVADAESAGIDTTASFRNEYNTYRSDLAKPYLKDQDAEDEMVREAYEHKKREVDVSHIMVAKGKTPAENERQIALLDSIRNAIIGGADFEALAQQYSIDGAVVRNKGHMGWLMADRVPYSFEKASYETPVGGISQVIETPFGYHIVRVEGERPASGEVLAQHILKLIQGRPAAEESRIKASIDSIYDMLVADSDIDFSSVARKESEDPGSASQGGMLPWFGRGRMVPEFEEVAFSLNNGEVSKPFKTSYGYHIVKRLDYRGVPDIEEVRPAILASMEKDGRAQELAKQKFSKLREYFKVRLNDTNINSVNKQIADAGVLDSALVLSLKSNPVKLGLINGETFTTTDVLPDGYVDTINDVPAAQGYLESLIDEYVDMRLIELETARLEKENPEFRNLLKEYHDGILLFDISNKRVWETAMNDSKGLEKWFESHRDKYNFDEPKYKGYIVYATSDSIMDVLKSLMSENVDIKKLEILISEKFGKEAKIEKVLVSKGDNRLVDAIVFNGPAAELRGRFKSYTLFNGKIIDRPEEMSDVRGAVTADYQTWLEQKWVKELKSKYPVKINKNRLKELR